MLFIGAVAYWRRRRGLFTFFAVNWRRGAIGGVMAFVGYWLVIWALTMSPMALVASLRETSVVFAVLIATLFLGEGFGKRRLAAAAAVVIGAVLLRM